MTFSKLLIFGKRVRLMGGFVRLSVRIGDIGKSVVERRYLLVPLVLLIFILCMRKYNGYSV